MAHDPLNDSPAGGIAPSHLHEKATASGVSHSADSRWQRRLLPFLVGTLGVLTVLFCAAIALETHYIQSRMESPLQLDLRSAVNQEFSANANFLLEANLIERRYRTADAAALSRIYIMFLGFGTGMVMALVGATFILGKISEPATSIDGSGSSFKASLHSGSPGVILAFLGTVLMLCTIFSKTEISLTDRAIYMGAASDQGALPQPDTQPTTPETLKTPDLGKAGAKGQPADTQKSSSAMPVLEAKNEPRRPDVRIVMSSQPTIDGNFTLDLESGPGTLSIEDRAVQFAGRDGKKRQVEVLAIDRTHVAFTVLEPSGGSQDFDGFLTDQDDIVGSTSYKGASKGSSPSIVFGFTAKRIQQK